MPLVKIPYNKERARQNMGRARCKGLDYSMAMVWFTGNC